MKKEAIEWNANGWTKVQDADAKKHVLEISVLSENGKVVEARIRHNDGEEVTGSVTRDGQNALPMALDAFRKAYEAGELEFR